MYYLYRLLTVHSTQFVCSSQNQMKLLYKLELSLHSARNNNVDAHSNAVVVE